MAFQPVPGTAEIVFEHRYTGSDKPYDIVEAVLRIGGWDSSSLTNLVTTAANAWAAEMAPYCPSTAELHRVSARDLSEEFGSSAEFTEAQAGTGEDVEWLPPNCSTGILQKCGLPGAPKHGYAFWPFVLEADCDRVGTLSGDALAVPGAWAAMWDTIETFVSDSTHVIISRYETVDGEKVKRDPALTNAVSSYVIGRGGFVSSQRDRRAG